MKHIKVGVDARSLLCGEPRGEGKSLLRLYQEIVFLRPDIEIIFFGDHTTKDFSGHLPERISVVPIDLPGYRFHTWENLFFPVAAITARCNVLHCSSSGGPLWSWQPQLLTIHDLIPILFDDGLSESHRNTFLRRLKNGLRNAKEIITVSEHTKNDLIKIFPNLKTNIEIIHWGCDQPAQGTSVDVQKVDAPYIIAFAGEAKRKNTNYALQRFISVSKILPTLKLFLIGVSSKKQREELVNNAANVGLADRVILPGFISEEELDSLVGNACALLYLSLYEGFGLPILEAICRKVPVIASDRTSIPEVLQGVPGCFSLEAPSEIESAIIDLASDPTVRMRWVSAQSNVLRRFEWGRTAALTIRELELCLR